MKKKDIIIIAAVLAAALALFGVSQIAGGKEASTVVVTVEGREVLRRPLAMSDTYEIKQDDGAVNVIAVENGAVYMKEANCRDGLCIHQGKMKNAAKTLVCLPHKLVVRLEGDSAPDGQDDLDVIIQGGGRDEPDQRMAGGRGKEPGHAACGYLRRRARAGDLHCRVVPHLAAVVALSQSDDWRKNGQL